MLDIRKIKENPDAVKAGLKAKEVDCDAIIDKILELDVQVRSLKTSTETKTAQKNKISKENGKLFGMKKGLEKKGEDCTEVNAKIADNVAAVAEIDAAIEGDNELLSALELENADLRAQVELQKDQIKKLQAELLDLQAASGETPVLPTDPDADAELVNAQLEAYDIFNQIKEAYADFDREKLEQLTPEMDKRLTYLSSDALYEYYMILEYVEMPSNG